MSAQDKCYQSISMGIFSENKKRSRDQYHNLYISDCIRDLLKKKKCIIFHKEDKDEIEERMKLKLKIREIGSNLYLEYDN